MHDEDRPRRRPAGATRPTASLEEQRRWGYDPHEDVQPGWPTRGADRRRLDDRRGEGGYGGPAGVGGMGGFVRDADPPIDAEREPGRARHLASGEGGAGDWTASAASIGQRRGPQDPDAPFGAGRDDERHAQGRSDAGWASAGSMQARSSDMPRGDDTRDAPPERPRGPKGWQRSDARIHDDVCERLAHSTLDTSDVTVEVSEGHVTLSGTVSDRPMKHAIESLVDRCHGVLDIANRIKVMRADPQGAAPPDTPPRPHASVPQDSPTAREEARGHFSRPMPGGAGR